MEPARKGQRVARGIAGCRRHVPNVGILRVIDVAKIRELLGINIADEDVGVVHAAHFVVMNVLGAQLGGQAVHIWSVSWAMASCTWT